MVTHQHRHKAWEGRPPVGTSVPLLGTLRIHRPPPDIARARGSAKAALLSALHLAIESALHLPWSNMDTWGKLQPISQQAQQLGFSVPSWVTAMNEVTTMRLLRFGLDEYSLRHHADSTECDFAHVLRRHSSTVFDPFSAGLPCAAVCGRLKDQWRAWAAPTARANFVYFLIIKTQ